MIVGTSLKIISGGQTGVDQGALDAALDLRFPCGGWCPAGRMDENGTLPEKYPLIELPTGGYRARTIRNLYEAGGTVIVYFGTLEGGTEMTAACCMKAGRPYRLIDGWEASPERAAELCLEFVGRWNLRSLNVAGPRASRRPEGHAYAYAMVRGMLERMKYEGQPKVAGAFSLQA